MDPLELSNFSESNNTPSSPSSYQQSESQASVPPPTQLCSTLFRSSFSQPAHV